MPPASSLLAGWYIPMVRSTLCTQGEQFLSKLWNHTSSISIQHLQKPDDKGDGTMELNKYAVQEQIEKECMDLDLMVTRHEQLIREAVKSDNEYNIAYAKQWLDLVANKEIKSTVEDKKQVVMQSTAEIELKADLAGELSKWMAEAIRVKIEILGAHRSILSSLKAEENNQPVDTPPPPFDDVDLADGKL
jgi:hypothetical protein